MLGLRLFISSCQGFYKKIAISKIEVVELKMKTLEEPG